MRINLKQRELILSLVEDLNRYFPDIKFFDVTESPENPNDLWINVSRPDDDDREMELTDFFSEKAADILMDYGYHMLVMPIR